MCKERPTRVFKTPPLCKQIASVRLFSWAGPKKCDWSKGFTLYQGFGSGQLTNEMRFPKRSLQSSWQSLSRSKFQARDLWCDKDKASAVSFLLTKTSIAFHHLHCTECRSVILKRRHIWKLVELYLLLLHVSTSWKKRYKEKGGYWGT